MVILGMRPPIQKLRCVQKLGCVQKMRWGGRSAEEFSVNMESPE
jgi:hypothetical protein